MFWCLIFFSALGIYLGCDSLVIKPMLQGEHKDFSVPVNESTVWVQWGVGIFFSWPVNHAVLK